MAVEPNRFRVFRSFDFPRIAVSQPVVGRFDLVTVFDFLMEHAVFVANAVTHHGKGKVRAAVKEARCEPPQTTVAQTSIMFLIDDFFEL